MKQKSAWQRNLRVFMGVAAGVGIAIFLGAFWKDLATAVGVPKPLTAKEIVAERSRLGQSAKCIGNQSRPGSDSSTVRTSPAGDWRLFAEDGCRLGLEMEHGEGLLRQ